MKRPPALGALTVPAVLALAAVTLANPPATAAAPPLSGGCATLHASEQNTITAQATISVTMSFAAGEQIRLTATGSAPSVVVTGPAGSTAFTPASGDPVRYDVSATGQHVLTIKNQPSGQISLTLACGIPPTITGTDGAHYFVNDAPSSDAACVAGTNPIADCVVGTVDTSSAGSRSYSVTATDTSGLQSRRTFSYTVAKKPQTLQFTSPPVAGAKVGDRYGSVVTAESSSGLPVTLTTDPGAPVCSVSSEKPVFSGNVLTPNAGTCNVYANQPGNDEYLPAPQISTSFEVARESTSLTAAKASKGLIGISGTTFSADLHYTGWFGPGYGAQFAYPGQTISFYVGGKFMCSGVTVQKDDGTFFGGGIATCKAPIGVQAALKYTSYTAVYGGSRNYLPSTAIGKLQ